MSEKLCLQWNDFKDNVNSTFRRLRVDKEFTDLTLVCEDGQQIEAHKVILTSSSPFFEKILQKSKHHHPLIYLKGFQSTDFVSILDFLYFGEANIFQEDFDSFLAIAEEIQLKGLTGQTLSDLMEEQENPQLFEPIHKDSDLLKKPKTHQRDLKPKENALATNYTTVAIPNQSRNDLQALDEKVKSMMEKSENLIPCGKRANGTPKQQKAHTCKVCGKEGYSKDIRDHIEANHLEGISFTCDFCNKTFSARSYLDKHKNKFH